MFLVVILAFFLWARAGHSICRNGFTKKNSVPKNFVPNSDNVYMSFNSAVRFTKELGISSVKELIDFIHSPEKPDDFPSNLKSAYAGQFVSYQDFLTSKPGTSKSRPTKLENPSLLKIAERVEGEERQIRKIARENKNMGRIINYEETLFEEDIF